MNNLSLKKLVLSLAGKFVFSFAGAAMALCMAAGISVSANAKEVIENNVEVLTENLLDENDEEYTEEFIVGYDENILLSDSTSTIYTVEYDGTYCQTDCRKMLELVNEFRTGDDAWYWNSDNSTKTVCTGLSELTYDYTLEKVAMQRAAECALSFSHTRPNGTSCWTAYSEIGYSYPAGENIAAGYYDYEAAFEGWEEADKDYSGQGHRRNMLSSSATRIGIAGIKYNGKWYWAMELGYRAGADGVTEAADTLTTVSAKVSDSYITSKSLTVGVSSVEVNENESIDIPAVTAQIALNETWPTEILCTVRPVCTYAFSDSSVATVSDGKIYGLKAGTTTLTLSAFGENTTVTVTVHSASNPIIIVSFDGNPGSSGTTASNVPSNQNEYKGTDFKLSTTKPKLTGYVFKGWATSASASSADYQPGDTCNFSANTTLYAVWQEADSDCIFSGIKLYVYKDGKLGMDFIFDTNFATSAGISYSSKCYVGSGSVTPKIILNKNYTEGKYTSVEVIVPVTPAQVESAVSVTLKIGSTSATSTAYTVSSTVNSYIDSVMNATDLSDDDRALLVSLLNYGSSIQEYFNSKCSASNLHLTTSQRTLSVPENLDSYAAVSSGACPGIEYVGSSLLVGSNTSNDTSVTVRHYFMLTGDNAITDYTVTRKTNNVISYYDSSLSFVQSGNLYYFDVKGATPEYFGFAQTVTVELTGSDAASSSGEKLTLSYSVMSYVKAAYDKYTASASTNSGTSGSSSTLGLAGVAGSGADSLTKLVVALAKYYEMIKVQ